MAVWPLVIPTELKKSSKSTLEFFVLIATFYMNWMLDQLIIEDPGNMLFNSDASYWKVNTIISLEKLCVFCWKKGHFKNFLLVIHGATCLRPVKDSSRER